MRCPRCGHMTTSHWPEHDRPETACAICYDDRHYTTEPGLRQGLCCWRSDYIAALADPETETDRSEEIEHG